MHPLLLGKNILFEKKIDVRIKSNIDFFKSIIIFDLSFFQITKIDEIVVENISNDIF